VYWDPGVFEKIISLSASHEKEHLVMEVSDNGPGIPDDIRSQVFVPFFTTKTGGTGIGMSIVRKIVVMSGGSIKLLSNSDQGTRFVITLPVF